MAQTAIRMLTPQTSTRAGVAHASHIVQQMSGGSSPGKVQSIDTTVEVDFPFGTYYFGNQIMVSTEIGEAPFAVPGDSGSLVIEGSEGPNKSIGLVFAAGLQKQLPVKEETPNVKENLNISAVCPMQSILDNFPELNLREVV